MIKRIKLKNFQSHKDSEIVLGKTVNSIIGLSDSGKSSFIRALNAILYRGPFYIRNSENEAFVEIEFDKGIVRREYSTSDSKKCQSCKEPITSDIQQCPSCNNIIDRSVSSDKYVVNGEVKEKFGSKLPEFITDVLRFKETSFVDILEKLQFSSQHGDMFFIGSSYAGGARNKILSCLIPDSDKVDILLKKVSSDLQTKKTLSEQLMKDNIILDKMIKDGQYDYDQIEILGKKIEIDTEENKVLVVYRESLQNIQVTINKLLPISSKLNKIQKISSNIQKIEIYVREKLEPLLKKIERFKKLSQLPKKFDVKPIVISPPDFSEMERIQAKIKRLNEIKINYVAAYMLSERLVAEKIKLEYQEDITKSDYNKLLGNSKCPIIDDKYCDTCLEKLRV